MNYCGVQRFELGLWILDTVLVFGVFAGDARPGFGRPSFYLDGFWLVI